MQKALPESQNMFEDLLFNIDCGVVIYKMGADREFSLEYVNDGFCRLYELTRDEVLTNYAKNHLLCVAGEYRKDVTRVLRKAIETHQSQEITYKAQLFSGQEKWVMANLSCVQKPDGAFIYGSFFDVTERLKSRQLLWQNEKITEFACDFTNLWIWIYEIETDIVHCYKKLMNDFEFPETMNNYPESWIEKGFIMSESVQDYLEGVRKIKNGENQVEFDCKVRYKDRTEHWVRCRFRQMEEDFEKSAGKKKIAICTCQPIDTEKVLEARIEIERMNQSVEDRNMVSRFVANLTQSYIHEHEYEGEIKGSLESGPFLGEKGSHIESFVYEDRQREIFHAKHNAARLIEQYEKGITEEIIDYRRICPDGNVRWVRNVIHLLKDPKSGDIYDYEYCYDIHDQKMLTEVLTAAVNYDYERFGSANLEQGQITMLYSDPQQQQVDIEVDSYETVSSTYGRTMVYEEDREMFLKMISLEEVRRNLEKQDEYEFTHRVMENGELHFKRTRFVLYDKKNRLALMTRQDVTRMVDEEEKKRQELSVALELAEMATQAKTDFLSRMSHEIRTPMNAIMGMTAIAKENDADRMQISECLDKIDMSSRYLLTLINDILEMSRIESGKTDIARREFDFRFLMNSVTTIVETLAKKSHIRYSYVIDDENLESHYIGDMMRIQQILVNIISNAIKFTKPDGKVRFSVEIPRKTREQAFFRFVIADTGIGMSDDFMERIFLPFSQENTGRTSQYSGSGLGLAISKSLAEAMGGTIQVESFLGIGSTFTVELPLERIDELSEEADKKIYRPIKKEEINLEGYKVLLAEDHPMNITVATRLLEKKGVKVTVAENGQDAVNRFDESQEGYYDAILMDIRMPVMDGLDAAKKIRSLGRTDAGEIPIIAMTANALDEDRKQSCAAGMNEHLSKPIEPAMLYETLQAEVLRYREAAVSHPKE
ncbi:MAG: PAS domain-containing hybrid sensor histidine kinase/response regulator [Clostridia bacterium]|nr:PAS domain-containing hybrid sensor histidine kinase/response regulator [Clostridia bacterium]NCC43351.1 PAS domain-containing hybrid sensor histidine kinase/response regulator [Clostridia bacterium]